jgi:hypothetical protein
MFKSHANFRTSRWQELTSLGQWSVELSHETNHRWLYVSQVSGLWYFSFIENVDENIAAHEAEHHFFMFN